MNYFRSQKLRNRPDRGGPIADQEGADSGSTNRELSDSAEDIFSVAKNHRADIIAREKAFKAHTGTKSKVPRG